MNTLSGAYYPKKSVLHSLDSRFSLIVFLLLVAVCVLPQEIYGFCFAFVAISTYAVLSRLPVRVLFGNLIKSAVFMLTILLMNFCFFSSENAYVEFWIFTPSYLGLMQGAKVVFRLVLAVVCANVLTATNTPLSLTGAMEWLISPLKFVKVPTNRLALIFSVALQFIPILSLDAKSIKNAQTVRGARFDSKNPFIAISAVFSLAIPVFVNSIRRADELSSAIEARGYSDNKEFSIKDKLKFGLIEGFALILGAAILAAQILIKIFI